MSRKRYTLKENLDAVYTTLVIAAACLATGLALNLLIEVVRTTWKL